MFSVVIPLYNKEREIKKTLESVLRQTFNEFEVIVINDGSTDRSAQIVKEFNDSRIRLINKNNGGVSSARNTGIQQARFQWIAFLDADDLWSENKLSKIASIIDNHPEVCWLFSAFKSIKGQKSLDRGFPHDGFFTDALDALGEGLAIQTSTVVVRRSFFLEDERLYFPIGVNNSEDREVWYKLIFKYPSPYYINEALSYYVIDQSGNSLNSGNFRDFSFLRLESRLADGLDALTRERRDKFSLFIARFNYRACWSIWVKLGWKPEFEGFVSAFDEQIMKFFRNYPIYIKRIISKMSIYRSISRKKTEI